MFVGLVAMSVVSIVGRKLASVHVPGDVEVLQMRAAFDPNQWVASIEEVVAANTSTEVAKFARFYLIPGMGHGSGVFTARADWLSVLEAWVECGEAPGKLVAIDGNTAAATAAVNGRTRPLCLYGTYPKYTGPASPTQAQANDAANFTCTPL